MAMLRQEIENAILKLQLVLGSQYAGKADVAQLDLRLNMLVDSMNTRLEYAEKTMELLERDKAGRDAVTNFKKWLTGGAILGTVFMAAQIVLTLYLVTHGQKK